MRLRVVGSSGTYPTANNPASGYLIENRETRVWCDAGPGTFAALPVHPDLVDAVFISHRHPDHCSDIFAAYHGWTFRPEPRHQIPLYASQDVLDRLLGFVAKAGGQKFHETFNLQTVGDGDSVSIGDVEVDFFEVSHSVPALGTMWTGDGRRLFYTGDTGPGDWETNVEGAHTLLSEAAIGGVRTDDDLIHHLNAFEAGSIARSAGVDQLVVTHVPPYLDLAAAVAEAESTFGKVVVAAAPGATIRI